MWDQPSVNLLSPEKTKYSNDVEASGLYATEQDFDEKVISDLNPGISVKSAVVFEVSKEEIAKNGWMIDVDGNKIALKL
jgi:hypothetical protein